MAGPITWRSIMGASLADAARPLELARQGLNDSLGSFGNVVRGMETVDAHNVQALDEAAKQAFLDRVSGASTPEALAALQSSGQLDSMRAGLSAASRAAVRGSEEARLASLRQQLTAGQQFGDTQRDRAELGDKDTILSEIAKGNFDGARGLVAMANIHDKAPLLNAIEQAQRTRLLQGQEQHKTTNALTESDLTLAQNQQAAKDSATRRDLDTQLSTASASYQDQIRQARDAISAEAAGLKLPVGKDGTVDPSLLTDAQRTAFNKHLNDKGLPQLDFLEGGDTSATENFIQSLRESGKYTPTQVAEVAAKAPALFSSTRLNPTGVDAQASARSAAQLDALNQSVIDNNGVVATPGNAEVLSNTAQAVIDKMANPGDYRHSRYTRQLNDFLAEGGIKVPDGNGNTVRVLPGPAQLEQILRRVNQSVVPYGRDDVKNQLEEWAKSPEAMAAAKQLINMKMIANLRKVSSATLSSATPVTAVLPQLQGR